MRSIQELIQKYQERLNQVIDPDDSSWDDLGFEEAPEGFDSPLEYQRLHGERDEIGQNSESLIGEFIEDLKNLQNFVDGNLIKKAKIKESNRTPVIPKSIKKSRKISK